MSKFCTVVAFKVDGCTKFSVWTPLIACLCWSEMIAGVLLGAANGVSLPLVNCLIGRWKPLHALYGEPITSHLLKPTSDRRYSVKFVGNSLIFL